MHFLFLAQRFIFRAPCTHIDPMDSKRILGPYEIREFITEIC